MHLNKKNLVDLLQEDDDNFEHQYDKYTLKELKDLAKTLNLRPANTKAKNIANILKKESPPTNAFSRYNDLWMTREARKEKAKYDKKQETAPKPTHVKIGCVKYNIANTDFWKKCDAFIGGKKCNKDEIVSVEERLSTSKYMCTMCIQNKRSFKRDLTEEEDHQVPAKKAAPKKAKK
jgi:hypothetical protein